MAPSAIPAEDTCGPKRAQGQTARADKVSLKLVSPAKANLPSVLHYGLKICCVFHENALGP